MGSIGGAEEAAHVLAIPDVQHGHIVPMLRLVKQFLRKGITVTFISFQAQISALALTDASSELQDLESEENFQIIGLRNVRKAAALTQTQFKAAGRVELGEAFEQQLMEKMVRDKTSGVAGGPTCILSDMFLPWTQGVAQKLQIPRYMLVPSGVIFARYMQGFADLYEVGELRTSEIDGKLVKFDGQIFIPGLPPLRYHEMTRPTEDDYVFFMLCCKSLWESAGVLINSFFELEEKVIESWTTPGHPDIQHAKVPKIYPIGPLFVAATADPNTPAAPGLEEPADKNLLWLSSQPTSSVLYIAFGSQVQLSPEQLRELALGLEDSNQRFLWVIPKPKFVPDEKAPSIADVLPPGFQARIGDRGCIVNGWAPQRQILTHSSTGAFLTHCGWNSSLETVMLGVPLIAWPQASEQFLNCRYLVDVLKIAEEVQAGAENIVERSEIERAVRLLMVESEGKAMRRKAEELQRMAEVAVAPGGSRSRAVEEFVHDILSRYHA